MYGPVRSHNDGDNFLMALDHKVKYLKIKDD